MRYSRAELLLSPRFNYIDLKTKIINNINKEVQAESQFDTMKMQRIMKRVLIKQIKIYKHSKEPSKGANVDITKFMLSNPLEYNYDNPGNLLKRI